MPVVLCMPVELYRPEVPWSPVEMPFCSMNYFCECVVVDVDDNMSGAKVLSMN